MLAALAFVLVLGGSGARRRLPSVHPPAPPARVPQAPDFGADVGQIFQLQVFSHAEVDRLLSAAEADGLGLARASPMWEVTEPRPPVGGRHHYDWRYDDFLARALRRHHLRWVAILAYAPRWASRAPYTIHGAPRSVADYAAYARAVARRYHGLIAAYEVWNEENSSAFWRPRPDPTAYARLYLAAHAAIRSVDHRAPVIIGGLADGNHGFLDRLLRDRNLRGKVGGLAVHPYARDPSAVLARVRLYRAQLRSLGWGRLPMYVTEFGWSTSPPGNLTYATRQQQSTFVAFTATALAHSGCGVRMEIFYAWFTPEFDRRAVNDWYGLSPAGGPSPAVSRTLSEAARALVAARPGEAARCGAASR